MFYDRKRKNGENSKPGYYLPALVRYFTPAFPWRARLEKALRSLETHPDRDYILDRVEYYNKLLPNTPLGDKASELRSLSVMKGKSCYVLDCEEYLRWFSGRLRWNYLFGDITQVPSVPTILKSRPIAGDNANSVLLNLDKARHFTFMKDRVPFTEKEDKFIFRGNINNKPNRIRFMEMFHDHPRCEAAIVKARGMFPEEWSKPHITLWEHLRYKFVLALEGNDVASNLKWVMSSNSIAVSPPMVYETWFMEGRLIPDYHYIEVKDDFSDLVEKTDYYAANPEKARQIIENANQYVAQFLNPQRERLISLLVLDKYFRMTGQR